MIRRLYVHNYRCLVNFELPVSGQSSILLIGKNGTGKTTVSMALQILQSIARGQNRVGELVQPRDFSLGRTGAPIRFELEVEIRGRTYEYVIAFELPERFKELRVTEERFTVDGKRVYTRHEAQVVLARTGQEPDRAEAIRRFSDENTLVLSRNSHLEPVVVRRLDEMNHVGTRAATAQ